MDIEHVRSRFIKHFDGTTGFVYASPGRINLIGEHTDYNGGFVFPGAIDKGMIAEIKPNGTSPEKAVLNPFTSTPRLIISRHTPNIYLAQLARGASSSFNPKVT